MTALNDQRAFLDRLKSFYILAVNEFAQNIPVIAKLPAHQRLPALRELHIEFGPKAVCFLSDLTHSVASFVRTETALPAVRAQTTATLASDLLTEVYQNATDHLTNLHCQVPSAGAAEASHRADFTALPPTPDSVLGDVPGGGVQGYAFGRIFGRPTAGGLYGALNGLESSIHQIASAMNARSQAAIAARRHIELLLCLTGFFVQLDQSSEKLFDWAASNTFGGSVDISVVVSTAREANELLREAVIPILGKLSIVSAAMEVGEEHARQQRELQKQQQEEITTHGQGPWWKKQLRWNATVGRDTNGMSNKDKAKPEATIAYQRVMFLILGVVMIVLLILLFVSGITGNR